MAEKEQGKKARVRSILFDPLITWGIERQAKMKVADYDAMLDRLAESLGHMSDANLIGLRELVTRHVGGKSRKEWPSEVLVKSWGLRLQPKPPRSDPYVNSLMRSQMGQKAKVDGYHVELFMLGLRIGPPPSRYEIVRLRAQGLENARKRGLVCLRRDRGVASSDDLAWLDWYERHERECERIMQSETEVASQ